MVMVSPRLNPQASWEFEAEILVLHHPTTISPRYQAMGRCLKALLAGSPLFWLPLLCAPATQTPKFQPQPRIRFPSYLVILSSLCSTYELWLVVYSFLQTLTKCQLYASLWTPRPALRDLTLSPSADIYQALLYARC